MFCGMPTVVQYEASELPASDGSAHGGSVCLWLIPMIACLNGANRTTRRRQL